MTGQVDPMKQLRPNNEYIIKIIIDIRPNTKNISLFFFFIYTKSTYEVKVIKENYS